MSKEYSNNERKKGVWRTLENNPGGYTRSDISSNEMYT